CSLFIVFYSLFTINCSLFIVFTSPPDLIEKALRKLVVQALRNEIDVTDTWLYSLPVSPPEA
ncbi:MAG TPA: hypothetical protein VF679_03905, partial [Pedobacter sp.]